MVFVERYELGWLDGIMCSDDTIGWSSCTNEHLK